MRQLITTKEPIKLEVEFDSELALIYVDDIHYATIPYIEDSESLDLNAVKHWVENTYYDDCYKSDQYVASSLCGDEFFKKEEPKDETYNGWMNRETWNVSLWICNDPDLYRHASVSGCYDNFQDEIRVYSSETPDGVKWNDPKLDVARLDELLAEIKQGEDG